MAPLDPQLLTALGCALAIFLCSIGSAVGSAQVAVYAVMKGPESGVVRAFVPIVSAGCLSIYGLIIAVLLFAKIDDPELSQIGGYKNLAAGLSVGLACLASGCGISSFLGQLNYDSDGKKYSKNTMDTSEEKAE